MRQIRERAGEIARGQAQPLLIAATPALAAGLVPAALQRMQAGADAARLVADQAAPRPAPSRPCRPRPHPAAQRLARARGARGADWRRPAGRDQPPLEHRGLTVHWIGQAACVVALPDNDPLAAHEVVPVSALAGRRLITMANPYRLRRRLDAALAANAPAAGTIETNSSINALAAVRAGWACRCWSRSPPRHAHAGRGDPFHRPDIPFSSASSRRRPNRPRPPA